jgi:hypothetical protein
VGQTRREDTSEEPEDLHSMMQVKQKVCGHEERRPYFWIGSRQIPQASSSDDCSSFH